MTNETALYFKMLLNAGMIDSYRERLNAVLEENPELDGLLLELAFSNNDFQEALLLLEEFLYGQKVDCYAVVDMLRSDLLNMYSAGRMNQSEIVTALYKMAINADYEMSEPWYTMLVFEDFYSLAIQGISDINRFNEAFYRFLQDGEMLSMSDPFCNES